MKIQILSDLHIDQRKDRPRLSKNADVIVIAGDITTNRQGFESYIETLVNSTEVPVIMVLGNHDYYNTGDFDRFDAVKYYKSMTKGTNIHVLERETLIIDGVTFLGTTLWTDYDAGRDKAAAYQSMPCFRYLYNKSEGVLFTPNDIIDEFNKNYEFLEKNIKPEARNVVVTHHVPSFNFISDRFLGNSLNGAFCADLNKLILDTQPDMWVCGHTHDYFSGQIMNCNIYCNPWGYSYERNRNGYKEEFIVEV